MAFQDFIGWIAAGLVFATFCANQMAALRAIAIASNFCFILYAYLSGLWPILVLHVLMLPINFRRLYQTLRD